MNREQRRQAGFVQLEDGSLIDRDVLGIVERIREYDPNLDVQYLDTVLNHDITDAPYRVVERCPDGEVRAIFSVWTLDERVLERVYAADMQRSSNDILARIDKNNQAARAEAQRRYQDQMDEATDIVAHVFKSPKGTYTFDDLTTGKRVKIDDSINLPGFTDVKDKD